MGDSISFPFIHPYMDEPITWMDELQVHNPNHDDDEDYDDGRGSRKMTEKKHC